MTATSTRSAHDPAGPRRSQPTSTAPLGAPLFLLNLKSYRTALGPGAIVFGRLLTRLSRRYGVASAIAPAPLDVAPLARLGGVPVLGQHADPRDTGAHTGYVLPDALRAAGARGSLVNHSEHPLTDAEVADVVERLRAIDLVPVVCAKDLAATRRMARLRPPYLAIEPPELIGGRRSVSTARPELVAGAVRAVRSVSPRTRVLCGAGVHDAHDVRTALSLGSQGVLVASAVAASPDPARVLGDLLSGFRPG